MSYIFTIQTIKIIKLEQMKTTILTTALAFITLVSSAFTPANSKKTNPTISKELKTAGHFNKIVIDRNLKVVLVQSDKSFSFEGLFSLSNLLKMQCKGCTLVCH